MKNHKIFAGLFALAFLFRFLILAADVSAAEEDEDFLNDSFYQESQGAVEVNDPLEPFNRAVFHVNDKLYTWVLDPVATGYNHAVPSTFRTCVKNFFLNLQEPVRFVNAVLQGRMSDSGDIFLRFLINSTLGVYGFGDAATQVFNIEPVEASLGETLETWGVGDGFFLMVPLYGPSTLRDFTGVTVESFSMTPYYMWTDDLGVMAGIYTGKEINKLSFHLGEYEDLKKLTFDPYIALRNIYFQHRRSSRERN